MADAPGEVQHLEPVWRDRSDFIIAARLPDATADREQLWARQLGAARFEICCIPFLLYDVALGDIVETASEGGRDYIVQRVIERSGRHVFRIWLGDSQPQSDLVAELHGLGALTEWSSPKLLAIDAANDDVASVVSRWLTEQQQRSRFVYEAGTTR
jgi:hypothetical protein